MSTIKVCIEGDQANFLIVAIPHIRDDCYTTRNFVFFSRWGGLDSNTLWFYFRFGILALDEPTTNLDNENVRSLCGALGEIVQERMRQKNFMFIIITHDREFIESLGNIDKVSHFYEVSRNDDGKSRIKKIRFS